VPLPGLIASFFVARSVPVIASVVLHGAIAVGLVVTAGGHARASAATPVAALDVEETTEAPFLAPVEPVQEAPPPVAKDEPVPTHTHAYPVAPTHDARPHDPSLHHDEDHHPAPAETAAPAPAAPALVADGAVLPRFTLASGSGTVASNGTGAGVSANPVANAPASDDVTHAASSVQVSARLVQSVAAAYPVHARADEVEGDVAVEIVVDREGRVVDARVTRPAGHGFDAAALSAVRAYRFSPAQREGRPVRVRMPWSVQFRLR